MVYKAGNSCPNIGAFIGQAEPTGALPSRIVTNNVFNYEVIAICYSILVLQSAVLPVRRVLCSSLTVSSAASAVNVRPALLSGNLAISPIVSAS